MKKIICGFFIVIGAAVISAVVEPIHPKLLQYKEGQNYFFTSDYNGRLVYVDLNETNDSEPRFDAPKDVVFKLFTRSNPTTATIIKLGDVSTLGSYGKTKATKIVAHGWNNDGNSEINSLIRDAYFKVMDVNIIVVDWGKGSNGLYTSACGNVPKVGAHVANLIDWLIGEGSSVNNFHVMGHSLGAHVAGIAGRSVTKGQIPYLTGFDPANPLWGSGSARIRSSDAGYVEIIHTNSGNLGISEPLGDNDFYPNEGSGQPGCSITNIGCSHGRSFEFFADSIDHTGFQANLCKDHKEALNNKCSNIEKLHMGGAKVKPAKGSFHLVTNSKQPYYRG